MILLPLKYKRGFTKVKRFFYNRRFIYSLALISWLWLLFVVLYASDSSRKKKRLEESTYATYHCFIPPEYHVLRAVDRTDWQVVVPLVQELVSDNDMCRAVAKAIEKNNYFLKKSKSSK